MAETMKLRCPCCGEKSLDMISILVGNVKAEESNILVRFLCSNQRCLVVVEGKYYLKSLKEVELWEE